MKIKLLLLLLFFTGLAGAQTITIPDANFKAKLLEANTFNSIAKDSGGNPMNIDVNYDGYIQQSEALQVHELNVSSSGITSLAAIEYFENLEFLDCQGNNLASLDVTALSDLETLDCYGNVLTTLNVAGMDNLRYLTCNNNQLVVLDLTSLEDLRELKCQINQLTDLEITNLDHLEVLDCSTNELATLDLTGLDHLITLNCSANSLTSLDFTGLEEYLETIICGGNNLTALNVSALANLTSLMCNDNNLTTLDLSANTNLETVSCYANAELVTLFIKNGKIENFGTEGPWGENPSLEYICVDEAQIAGLLAAEGLPDTVQINSFCSYEPGGLYNMITGTLTYDAAGDGCGGSDGVMPLVKMKITAGAYEDTVFTDADGNYRFYTGAGEYTVTPQFENDYFVFDPTEATVNFPAADGTVSQQNFCIAPNGVHPDVEVVMVPVSNAVPGFDAMYKIVYKNKGTEVLSGSVTCNWNSSILDYVSMDPPANEGGADSYTWYYTDLKPFENRAILMTLNVNGPMDTPAVNIDDVIPFTMQITPGADDIPDDNTFAFSQVAVGSYDPNNIVCVEGDMESPDAIGEYLHYMVNFENTGNEEATFIVVTHDIDPTEFDINSLQLINSSHEVTTRLNGNRIEFRFENISLAAADHGNILFKLKSHNGLTQGDMVTNQANIYFDYNFPVATNPANTTFAVLSTGHFERDNSVTVYPNPSRNIVNISADASLTSVQLFDVQGRLLQTALVNDTATTLDIAGRAAGIYFLKITTDRGVKVEKIVKE
jgi:Leucine-rich repeat (LRR) protein